MADALDMSLDDLITKNKAPHSRGRGRRNPASASGGPAPARRRFRSRAATRSVAAPYHQLNFQQQAPPAFGYVAQPMAMVSAPSAGLLDTPTKLYISNLDYNVSNEDIKDLFSEMGEIKRYSINYDKSGRSKGTAEVVFSTKSEALAALKKYNNVHLDGKPMKIEVIGTNIEAPPAPTIFAFAPPPAPAPAPANFSFPSKSGPGRGLGGGRGWLRGGGGFSGRGRGRGVVRGRGRGGRSSSVEVSAADLDADLDKYHSAAVQIS